MAHISDVDKASAAVETRGRVADAGSGRGFYKRYAKRVLDVVAVLLAAPLALVLIAVLAVWVRRDGGPAFYSQDRIGQDGRVFRFWKLRSMVVDAEARLAAHLAADPGARSEWAKHQKLSNDPRVTPFGQLLRKTSLDELPQLWNVLRGDMSLVGPRPMMPEQRGLYPGEAYFALRPGLTGFWQIRGRNNVSFADRALYDTLYAERLSLLTDVMVLLVTVFVVLRGTGR
jgi:exopolysaccharide production protein ExoY